MPELSCDFFTVIDTAYVTVAILARPSIVICNGQRYCDLNLQPPPRGRQAVPRHKSARSFDSSAIV